MVALQKINDAMRSVPIDWYLGRTMQQVELLFGRYAPWRPGDRVRLTRTPLIDADHSPGWIHSKHFLVVGAIGTIESIDADRSGFSADVVFDEESWIDESNLVGQGRGATIPIEDKHTYGFSEEYLELASRASDAVASPRKAKVKRS